MDGVIEVSNVDKPYSNADEGNDFGQLLSKLVKFLLQGGLLLFSGGHLITNFTNFSVGAGGNDNTNGFAGSYVGTLRKRKKMVNCFIVAMDQIKEKSSNVKNTNGEQHVFLVLVDSSGVGNDFCVFDDRDGLSCWRKIFQVRIFTQ